MTLIIMISSILMLFFLDQCSVNNISSSKLFKKKEFDKYKYLKDNISTDEYEVIRISDYSNNTITYDTTNNYFIVTNRSSIIKINSKGKVIKNLKEKPSTILGEKHIEVMLVKTHYAFTDSLVYDFSKKNILTEPFKSISIQKNEWKNFFIDNYKMANVVLYGNQITNSKGYPIFMKINSEWIRIYSYYQLNQKEYPEKLHKLIYLKDGNNNNCYSNWLNKKQSNSDLSLEDYLNYPLKPIKMLYFQKELSLGQIQNSPITESYGGTAYYNLEIGSNSIKFKENAIKSNSFFSKIESHLFHFNIPKRFSIKSNISFIQLSYPTNANKSGSNGLYIIKRKLID